MRKGQRVSEVAIWGGGCKIELLGSWDKEEGGLSELGIASQGILLETVLCCNATVAYCSWTLLSRLGVLSAVCKLRPPSHAPGQNCRASIWPAGRPI